MKKTLRLLKCKSFGPVEHGRPVDRLNSVDLVVWIPRHSELYMLITVSKTS
jgi:hypothetical protein